MLLLGVLLGPCVWLAPTGAQPVTQCTDIKVGAAQLSKHRAFGGPEFCCRELVPDDGSAPVLCCPGDGTTEYGDINVYCTKDKVELRPSAEPDRANFMWENVCPACLDDGSLQSCLPGTLQLDNIQTQGPQVRAQRSHARQAHTSQMARVPNGPRPEWPQRPQRPACSAPRLRTIVSAPRSFRWCSRTPRSTRPPSRRRRTNRAPM